MHWTTPCKVPNWESKPRDNSIRKNKTAHKLAKGNWFTASVNKMKAKPVPLADWKKKNWSVYAYSFTAPYSLTSQNFFVMT